MEAIVEAAAQVFEREGYAAGTTNRIAERAGVSIGSIYQYFADKDALLRAVVEQHVADGARMVAEELARLEEDPDPAPALERILSATIALHRDRPRLHRLIFEEAALGEEVLTRVHALEEAAATQVAAYLARLPDPPGDPLTTARLIVQAVETWAHRFVIHPPDDADEPQVVAAAVRLLAQGLSR